MNIKLLLFISFVAWFLTLSPAWSRTPEPRDDGGKVAVDLEQGFRQPRDEDKPWAYWWWLKGNVTEASITRDLEAMKQAGFGGLLHFDVRGYHEDHVPPPESRMEFMSPPWRQLLKHAIAESSRLGLEMSVNLSSSAGALKGPWDVGGDAPKRLMWTAVELQGPRRWTGTLRRPAARPFWDVAVLAVRHEPSPDIDSVGRLPGALAGCPAEDRREGSGPRGGGSERPRGCPGAALVGRARRPLDADPFRQRDDGRARIRCGYPGRRRGDKALRAHGPGLLEDAGPAAGKTLTHFYSVSWEGATPLWTPGIDDQFARRRGYRPRPYLPVLAGWTVQDRDVSARFLRDYLTTLGDLFMDNFYGTLRQLCHRAGLSWHSESGGPWDRSLPTFTYADQLAFLGRNDMPQGEFWFRPVGQSLNRPIAMAATSTGGPARPPKSFTHMVQHWSADPSSLKPRADAAFCDGINHLIWHTFTSSLAEFGQPGSEYFAGTHLNPNVTWWNEAGSLLQYLARCQFLLRQGQFVGDVCCYPGDSTYLHWGRAEKWSPQPTQILGRGYAYDLINTEVLLNRLSVRDGMLVLPEGMSYRILVVDLVDERAQPQVIQKLIDLAKAGATIVLGARRPRQAPGLTGYPACDEEVRRLAAELWGEQGDRAFHRSLGKGKLVGGTAVDDVLRAEGVLPDFEGPWDFTHRRAADLDVYFLAGEGRGRCTFRVSGKEPELWNPATGVIRDAVPYHATDDGRTIVPIDLPRNGSVFVVFRKPAPPVHLVSVSGPDDGLIIAGCSGTRARVDLWRRGSYVLETSQSRSITVEAPILPESLTVSGPWEVQFQPGRGAPASAVFPELIAWDQHSDARIKYFSGTATYRKTISLNEDQTRRLVRLSLGEVKNIARVRVNGKDLGVAWTDPWMVDLTGALKPGDNALEIDVTNLWVNRLIGDAGLPEDQRHTRTNVALRGGERDFKAYQGFASTDPLLPSGLLGPVHLEFGERREVPFH